GAEGGALGAGGEVACIPLALLERGEIEAELSGGHLALGGVREQRAERLGRGAEAEGAERLGGIIHGRHRTLRGRGGSRRGRRRGERARGGARDAVGYAASRRGWRARRSRGCLWRAAPPRRRGARPRRRGRAA